MLATVGVWLAGAHAEPETDAPGPVRHNSVICNAAQIRSVPQPNWPLSLAEGSDAHPSAGQRRSMAAGARRRASQR